MAFQPASLASMTSTTSGEDPTIRATAKRVAESAAGAEETASGTEGGRDDEGDAEVSVDEDSYIGPFDPSPLMEELVDDASLDLENLDDESSDSATC
mmetsp:Transcript_11894/g.29218  ORF Transcript_11894/g.29218 Transcript_11894/m.29218 type:complete len:97 (-) Transcript_11894:173-463(-)